MASKNVSRGNLSISGKTFISYTPLNNTSDNLMVIGNGGEVNVRSISTLNNTYLTGGTYDCSTSTLTLNNTGGSDLGTSVGPYLSFSGSGISRYSVVDSSGNLYVAGNFSGFENSLDINNIGNSNPYLWGDLDSIAVLDSNQILTDTFKTPKNYNLTSTNRVQIDSNRNIYLLHQSANSISGVSAPMYWSVIDGDGNVNTSIDFQSHVLLGDSDIITDPTGMYVTNNDKIILIGNFLKYSGASVTDVGNIVVVNQDGSLFGNFHQLNITNQSSAAVNFAGMSYAEDDNGDFYFAHGQIQINNNPDTLVIFKTDSQGNLDNTFTPFTGNTIGSSVLNDGVRVKIFGNYIYLIGNIFKLNDITLTQDFNGVLHSVGITRVDKNTGEWDSEFLIYFAETTFEQTSDSGIIYDIHVYDDDSTLVTGSFDHYSGTALTSYGIVKLNSDLTINVDANFGVGFNQNNPGNPIPRPHDIHLLPDNNILITGQFSGYSGNDQWHNIVKISNNSQNVEIPFNVCNTFTGGTSFESVNGSTITIEGGCCNDIVITGVTGVYVTGATTDYTGVTLSRNDDVNVLIDSEQTIRTKYTGITVGTTTLVTIPVSTYGVTHIEYMVTNGTGVRGGILMGSFESGTKVEMSDVCTADTTDFSSDFEFDITASGQVQAIVTSGTYTIVFNTRAIER